MGRQIIVKPSIGSLARLSFARVARVPRRIGNPRSLEGIFDARDISAQMVTEQIGISGNGYLDRCHNVAAAMTAMNRFLFLAALATSVAFAFQPLPVATHRRLAAPAILRSASTQDDEDFFQFSAGPAKSSPKSSGGSPLDALSNIDVSEALGAFKNVDLSSISQNADDISDNLMSGNFGERGEVYTAAQAALVLCVLGGGIPVVGNLLMFILGPVLLLAGLGVVVVAVGDIGPALSPWPAATDKGLSTDGMFGQMRHPMYAGLIAACAGLSIVSGSATRLLLTAVLMYVLDVKSDYEEADLRKTYPEYDAYAQEVKGKFFPQEILDQMPWNVE